VIPSVEIEVRNVRVDIEKKTLEKIGKATFSMKVDSEAVTGYLRKHGGKELKDLEVEFRDSSTFIKGTPKVKGFDLPAEVEGTPVLKGKRIINFEAKEIKVLGIPLPKAAIEELEDKLNPVLDLSGLELPIELTKVEVEKKALLIEAKGRYEANDPDAKERDEDRKARDKSRKEREKP
jgi:hypothetical protein